MKKEKTIKIAATQMSCSWELENNLSKAKNIIYEAAKKGANIILLQELFQTPYLNPLLVFKYVKMDLSHQEHY